MAYEDNAGHSQDNTVNGPLIMHTMLSATHRFSSNRLLATLCPMDRARNTHRFAVVPMTATSTTWMAIKEVAMVEKSSSINVNKKIFISYVLSLNHYHFIVSSSTIEIVKICQLKEGHVSNGKTRHKYRYTTTRLITNTQNYLDSQYYNK